MARLCSRPGCSEAGTVAYGMVPEDAVFWLAHPSDAPTADASMLCRRHADAMVVPRGWTLDDRRENVLRLFTPRPQPAPDPPPTRSPRRARSVAARVEQLQIDGTGEIGRPPVAVADDTVADDTVADDTVADDTVAEDAAAEVPNAGDPAVASWEPEFDHDDDLNGLLEVQSPLLARAFRGRHR